MRVFILSQIIKMPIFSLISEISAALKSPAEPHHYSGKKHVHIDGYRAQGLSLRLSTGTLVKSIFFCYGSQLGKLFSLVGRTSEPLTLMLT